MERSDLDYAPVFSEELIYELERAAQWLGLRLERLELLGQDPEVARAFVDRVAAGRGSSFLEGVDWPRLRGLRERQLEASATDTTNSEPALA